RPPTSGGLVISRTHKASARLLRTPVQNGDAGWSSPFGLKLIHWINSLTASPHQATPDFAPGPQTPGSNGDAGWSSPVARQAHNLKVVGSNPTPATKHQLLSNQHSMPRATVSAGGTHASLTEVAPRPADHKLRAGCRCNPPPWANIFPSCLAS